MLAFLPLLVCSATGQVPPPLLNVHRIVMLGDSITQIGSSPKGYVTLVTQTLQRDYPQQNIVVINAGVSGNRANDMLARYQKDVLDQHPDLITINVGVNDVWHDFRTPSWSARVPAGNSGMGLKLPVYIKDVQTMIREGENAHARVVLLAPTLVYEELNCAENLRILQYVRAERKLAARDHVQFIDLNHAFRAVVAEYQRFAGKTTRLLTVDGVHPNTAGNALLANVILHALGAPTPDRVDPAR